MIRRLVLLALLSASAIATARAQSDSTAVIGVAQRLLDAINRRDTTLARTVLAPGAAFVSIRSTGQSTTPPRRQADTAFIRMLATGQQKYLERMWAPTARVKGAIADVWAPYDFHIDGTFSHCGIDTFTLLKGPSGWQIVSISYTVEPNGCAPSPLGPPR